MAAAGLYYCANFCLRSEVPLSELAPAQAPGGLPVIDVRLGAVSATAGAEPADHGLQVVDDSILLAIDGVARFQIGAGEILVEPSPGGSERNLRLFLLGSALGILCHRRGLLPLHANAIVVGEAAYAFSGPSGAGKSTLAAYFARAGYEILCDDVCSVSFEDGVACAWPGLPRLKLWGDAAEAFGHDRSSLDQAIEGLDKYHVPIVQAGAPRPVPLRRLYLLGRADDESDAGVSHLRGRAAMNLAMTQTYRSQYLRPLGLLEQNFRQCANLVASAEVYEVRRTWGYDVFEKQASFIEQHILSGFH